MIYGAKADHYRELGWNPVPLPAGLKYPPPDDWTGGNVPDPTDDEMAESIRRYSEGNLGLRMPAYEDEEGITWEVLGIDVDQYEGKDGWTTIIHMIDKLGDLPNTYKSSSRGLDSVSGIYFFRVPAGKKWRGKVGSDVEVIQRTHRYAVAWPSVVSDREYEWYFADELDEGAPECRTVPGPPDITELPELPGPWQERLVKGNVDLRERVEADETLDSVKAVRAWMAENFPGYNAEPSSEMARACELELLQAEAAGGAHDMLVSRSHQVIMLAVEGHHGTEIALSNVRKAFFEEVLGKESGEARRSLDEAKREYARAIVNEIVKLKQDIDSEYVQVSAVGGFSAEDMDIETETLLDQVLDKLAKRRKLIDARDYSENDRGSAKMLRDYWDEELKPVDGDGEKNWIQWDYGTKRIALRSPAEMYNPYEKAVERSLEETAKNLYALADQAEDTGDGDGEQLGKDADDMKRRQKIAGNKSKMDPAIAVAHTLPGERVDIRDFDKEPLLIGVGNGVLDLTDHPSGMVPDLSQLVRQGTPHDRVRLNTEVNYYPDRTHPLWESYLETFIPDPEYRRFVRKVLGYGLIAGNPDRLIVFLQGGTSTGKSTMLDAVQAALGGWKDSSYASTVNANALFREKQDAGPAPEMMKALPKRMVFCSEIGTHNRLHSDVIKRLTGGDAISARALYSNKVIDQQPMFTPYIATNSMPTIQDGDSALWRRLLVLPFDHSVPGENPSMTRIKDVPEALEAVLSWLVDGLLDYLLERLPRERWPAICKQRQQAFIAGTSDFQAFLSEYTSKAVGSFVERPKLHSLYRQWAIAEGIKHSDMMSSRAIGTLMRQNGYDTTEKSVRKKDSKTPVKSRFYVGLSLKKDVEEDD